MRKLTKILIVVSVLALTATLAGASLLEYFGSVQTTINISQAVKIDGKAWDDITIKETINGTAGYIYYSDQHKITNDGGQDAILTWNNEFIPNSDGVTIIYEYWTGASTWEPYELPFTLNHGSSVWVRFGYDFATNVNGSFIITSKLALPT